jgi:hypothetical protein
MAHDDDTTRHAGDKHGGPDHASPYPISRLAPPVDLVDTAREIQRADETIRNHVGGKLQVIAEQMRALRDQAQAIMAQAQRDAELHRAVCQFKKRPGQIYHLYERSPGELYFSMLSPEDWNGAPPHPYKGAYRLEADLSWTAAEELGHDAGRDAILAKLLE